VRFDENKNREKGLNFEGGITLFLCLIIEKTLELEKSVAFSFEKQIGSLKLQSI